MIENDISVGPFSSRALSRMLLHQKSHHHKFRSQKKARTVECKHRFCQAGMLAAWAHCTNEDNAEQSFEAGAGNFQSCSSLGGEMAALLIENFGGHDKSLLNFFSSPMACV